MDNLPHFHAGDLLLVGGGHTHGLFLRRLSMARIPGLRVTLVSATNDTPYSGLLHGVISGTHGDAAWQIDLRKLCRYAGATFIHGQLVSIDLAARQIALAGRPPMGFDLLSLNTGSTPAMAGVPGASQHAVPAKPMAALVAAWNQVRATADSAASPLALTVVGGGPGGVEMALAMQARLGERASVTLVQRESTLLPEHAPRAGRRLAQILRDRGITLRTGQPVARVDADRLVLADGTQLASDRTFWVTHAAPPAWISSSGLAQDATGFIRVRTTLQTVTDDHVFATGDVASIDGLARPKSGVHAVRQAPTLDANVRAWWLGDPLVDHQPQKHCLSLISTSDGSAFAVRGRWAVASRRVARLKERIDHRFMEQFTQLSVGQGDAPPVNGGGMRQRLSLSQPGPRCLGCGSKLASNVLQKAVLRHPYAAPASHPAVPVDLAQHDDGAALALDADRLLVQSVDHLSALIDDLYLFGRIAVLHAFSDIYAMGARPHSALATIVTERAETPLMTRDLEQMMAGVRTALSALGATLIGGHSVEGDTASIGISANGTAGRGDLLRKEGMRKGDAIILTKPLGIGTLFASAMRAAVAAADLEAAVTSMLRPNAAAADVLHRHGVTACTDVTGFGFAGHLLEMADASRRNVVVTLDQIPALAGALEAPFAGSMYQHNRTFASRIHGCSEDHLQQDKAHANPQSRRFMLLFDPQTSGGLLATVSTEQCGACLTALRRAGETNATCVGHVGEAWDADKPIDIR